MTRTPAGRSTRCVRRRRRVAPFACGRRRPGSRVSSPCARSRRGRREPRAAGPDLAPGQELDIFSGGAAVVLVGALAERGVFAEAHEFLRGHRLGGDLGPALWEVGCGTPARGWRCSRATTSVPLPKRSRRVSCASASVVRTRRSPLALDRRARARPSRTPRRGSGAGRRGAHRARRFGARVPIARALHARAVAEPDHAARAALCTEGWRSRRRRGGRAAARARQRAGVPGLPPAKRARRCGPRSPTPTRPARCSSPGVPGASCGDGVAAAPRGARRRGRVDTPPTADLRTGLSREGQSRDRAGAVPERQDGRDPPRRGLSQAGRERADGVGARARGVVARA